MPVREPYFEISPAEREDERIRDERDFGVQEQADQEQQDRIRRTSDGGGPFEE